MAKVICTKTSGGQYESQGTFTLGEAAYKASQRKEGEGRIQVEVGGCWIKGTYLKGRTGALDLMRVPETHIWFQKYLKDQRQKTKESHM